MSARFAISLILTIGLLGTSIAPADEVLFKSGDRREGRVEDIVGKPDRIALTTASGRIEVYRDSIQKATEQDDATDWTILGQQFLRLQSYDRAIQMFQKAIEADPKKAEAKTGMEEARKRIEEQRAEADRQRVSRNGELLEQARKFLPDEKFDKAESLVAQVLQNSPSEEQKAAAQLVSRDLYLAWGLSRLDRLDKGGAETYLQKVLEIDPQNPTASEALLRVWESDSSKREEVLGAYRTKLKAAPDDAVLNQKIADLLLAMGRKEEAIEPMIKLASTPVFRTRKYDERLEDAMKSVAADRAQKGDLDGAITAYKRLLETFPAADPSPLVILEYQKKLAALKADDWKGRGDLLVELDSQGLEVLATQEAELILRSDPTNEKATALLRRNAVAEFDDITEASKKQQWLLARSLAQAFAEKYTRFPEMVQRATDAYSKADLEAQKDAKRLRDKAKEVATTGDNYLAEARRSVEMYKSADNNNRSSVISYKQEALKYTRRAIDAYKVALKIDPTLGPLVGGMDLNSKLSDAQTLEASLTRSAIKIRTPQGKDRRRTSGS